MALNKNTGRIYFHMNTFYYTNTKRHKPFKKVFYTNMESSNIVSGLKCVYIHVEIVMTTINFIFFVIDICTSNHLSFYFYVYLAIKSANIDVNLLSDIDTRVRSLFATTQILLVKIHIICNIWMSITKFLNMKFKNNILWLRDIILNKYNWRKIISFLNFVFKFRLTISPCVLAVWSSI